MTGTQDILSEHLNFPQRYGYKSLPNPMQLEEISHDLRREIGNRIRLLLLNWSTEARITRYLSEDAKRFSERVLGKITRKFESEISTHFVDVSTEFEDIIKDGEFYDVLYLLELIIEELSDGDKFSIDIKELFDKHVAAHWLDTSKKPFRFVPCASKDQGDATRQAIETIRNAGLDGAATHLRQAANHINAKQFADSIADSIHAVESVARIINPDAKKYIRSGT